MLWKKANEAGIFTREIAGMDVKAKRGVEHMGIDEHPRASSMEDLAKLKPVFKENGVVTAVSAVKFIFLLVTPIFFFVSTSYFQVF